MHKHSRTILQTAAYALAIALSKGVSLVMLPIITHALPLAEYGRLELWVACADIGSVILGFGLVDALLRFASSDSSKPKAQASIIFGISMMVACGGLALGQFFATPLLHVLPAGLPETEFRILLATLALTACVQIPLLWLRMQDKALHYCGLFAGKAILQAGLIIFTLELGYGVAGILFAGLAADIVLTVILAIMQYRDTGIRFSWNATRKILPYNAPLMIGGLAGCMLGSFDRMILVPMVGADAVAHYALAGKFALMVALAAEPFNMWWFARRFAVLNEQGGALTTARTIVMGSTYIACAAFGIALVAPWMILFLTPESYHPAAMWVPFLCGLAALHAITNLVTVGTYIGKTGLLPTYINYFSAFIAFAGYMLLIPSFGVAGAVGATYIAYIVRFICFFTASQKRAYIPYGQGIVSLLSDLKQRGVQHAN